MIKKIFALFLSFLLVLLTGCTGYTESDSRYIVSAIGFEESAEGIAINIQALTANELKGEIAQNTYTGSGSGCQEAFSALKTKLAKPISFEHCSAVILSGKLKKEENTQIFEFCRGLNRLNTSVYFGVCDDIKTLLSLEAVSEKANGYDISAFIETKEETEGLSYKNRLYEILSSREDFIPTFNLPSFSATDDKFFIDGEYIYTDFSPVKKLDNTESLVLSVLSNRNSGGNVAVENETAHIDKVHTYFSSDFKDGKLYINLKTDFSFKKVSEGFEKAFTKRALELLNQRQTYLDFAKILEQKHKKVFNKVKDDFEKHYKDCIIEYKAEGKIK